MKRKFGAWVMGLCFLLQFNNCSPRQRVVIKEGATPTPTSNGANPTATPTSDGTGKLNPFIIRPIIAHGANNGVVVWASDRVTPTLQQSMFVTDSTLKLRVIARPAPGKGTDSLGVSCTQYAMNYTKLEITVGIKEKNATTYVDIKKFANLVVDEVSTAQSFYVPASNTPFVIEMQNPRWNWTCNKYVGSPYEGDSQFCPYDPVYHPDCIELELQMVTDYTKDFS